MPNFQTVIDAFLHPLYFVSPMMYNRKSFVLFKVGRAGCLMRMEEEWW